MATQEQIRDVLLTVDQVAERLSLSPTTIRAWVLKRRIEHVRLGRAVRIRASVVDGLIADGTTAAVRPSVAEQCNAWHG